MKLHLFHFSPTGLVRALNQLVAGYKLCSRHGARLRDFVPGSIPSMTAAWNFSLLLKEYCLAKPKTIIDAGANASQMTKLLMLECEPDVSIFSFEPNAGLLPIGTRFELALSDEDGEAQLVGCDEDDLWGKIEERGPVEGASRGTVVRMARFDTLVEKSEFTMSQAPRPVLLKIDAEGHELRIVKGFGRHMNEMDYLLCEIENRSESGGNYSLSEMCGQLSRFGFDNSRVLYACYDGPLAPAHMDVLFWRGTVGSRC